MIFSATSACAHCRLRFARRDKCPSCGSVGVASLATLEGRTSYRRAASSAAGTRLGLGARAIVPAGIAVGMMAPAAVGLAMGVDAGLGILGLAAAGLGLLAFTIRAKLGAAQSERLLPAKPVRMRVHVPDESARGDTTLAGVARRASVEIESPLTAQSCLIFGLRGEAGDIDIADADGGDFDLELPSGERVMISLEHALLLTSAPAIGGARVEELGGVLADLLEQRGVAEAGEAGVLLEEVLVRDGDEVTVTGTPLGGKVTSLGASGARVARVLAGDAEHPLVVQLSARA